MGGGEGVMILCSDVENNDTEIDYSAPSDSDGGKGFI